MIRRIRDGLRKWLMVASTSGGPAQWFVDYFGGGESASGINVNQTSSLTFSAVWQATNVLSGDVGMLPVKLYKREDDQNKEPDRDHPSWSLMKRPNRYMGWLTFVQTVTNQSLLHGNGYAWITRNGRGEPVSMIPLMSDRTGPVIIDGRLWYETDLASDRERLGGQSDKRKVNPRNMLHIKGLGWDGLGGISVITLARDSWGMGLAAQRHGGRYFANYATPQGILKVPDKPTEEDAKRIRRDWKELTSGDNEHDVAVLWGESDYKQVTINNRDSQWLESRKFSRAEVASWFNLPPHKVGDMEHATYSNITDQNRDYLQRSLMRWLVTWEQEMNLKLLTPEQQEMDTHFFEFVVEAFLRGDMESRTMSMREQFMHGKLTLNEWRGLDNQNSIGELGDLRFVPLNMTTLELAAEGPQESDPAQEGDEESEDDMDEDESDVTPVEEDDDERARNMAVGVMTSMLKGEANSIHQFAIESKNFLQSVEDYYNRWQKKFTEIVVSLGGTQDQAECYVVSGRELCLDVAGKSLVSNLADNAEMAYSNYAAKAEAFADSILKGGE